MLFVWMIKMQAELRELHSPDVNLETYQSEEATSFGFLVAASIGIKGQEGEEIFSFVLCSPLWFAEHYPGTGYIWGVHHLFMNSYSYKNLYKAVVDICRGAEGENWNEIVAHLRRYFAWEFDDYRP
jgi:hypothetical protein